MHLSIAVIVILTGYGGHGPGGSPAPPLWQQPRAFSLAAGAQQAARVASPKLLPGVAEAVNKGFDLLGRNDAAGAEAAFRQAIDLEPEVEMAHRGLGLALKAEGQNEAALREFEVATRLDPADVDAHYALADTAWTLSSRSLASQRAGGAPAQSYLDLAAAEYAKLAVLRPQDAELRQNQAQLDLDAGPKRGSPPCGARGGAPDAG